MVVLARNGLISGAHGPMASAVAPAYNGGWGLGAEPVVGSRGRASGQGIKGVDPLILEAERFWFLDVQWKSQICPLF